MSKKYVVMKNEKEIESLKTLTAAKKLADAENAEVYCNGELVYNASGMADDNVSALAQNIEPVSNLSTGHVSEHPTESVGNHPTEPVSDHPKAINPQDSIKVKSESDKKPIVKYRLRNAMNVRKEPSMLADIRKTLSAGTVVEVTELKDDWLHLTDGSYILYCEGKFAEKI